MAIEAKNILQKESIETVTDKGYYNAEQIQIRADHNIITYVALVEPFRSNPVPAPEYYGAKYFYNREADHYTCPQGHSLTTNGSWYDKKYKNTITKLQQYKTSACRTCPVKELCTNNPKGRIIDRKQYAKAVEDNEQRIRNEKDKYDYVCRL